MFIDEKRRGSSGFSISVEAISADKVWSDDGRLVVINLHLFTVAMIRGGFWTR
jgi:hypothetical protein